jgi:hypothetical protein
MQTLRLYGRKWYPSLSHPNIHIPFQEKTRRGRLSVRNRVYNTSADTLNQRQTEPDQCPECDVCWGDGRTPRVSVNAYPVTSWRGLELMRTFKCLNSTLVNVASHLNEWTTEWKWQQKTRSKKRAAHLSTMAPISNHPANLTTPGPDSTYNTVQIAARCNPGT